MKPRGPFTYDDLQEFDERLLSRAARVVPMRDIYKGDTDPRVIGLRHDVDTAAGSYDTALAMAEWEFERGYSSTYYLLHTAPYWNDETFASVYRFEELGHEVGIHVNAVAQALREGGDPARILARALAELRAEGVRVVGSAGHGDRICRDVNRRVVFANDEMFTECARPDLGKPKRKIDGPKPLKLDPVSRSIFGLEYDAAWLSCDVYLSDSGGKWSQPFERVVSGFGEGQLHILQHPDHWTQAFVTKEVAA